MPRYPDSGTVTTSHFSDLRYRVIEDAGGALGLDGPVLALEVASVGDACGILDGIAAPAASGAPATRYDPYEHVTLDEPPRMVPQKDGEWVRYEDHLEEVRHVRESARTALSGVIAERDALLALFGDGDPTPTQVAAAVRAVRRSQRSDGAGG